MALFSDFAKTDEFKQYIRQAVDEIVRADLIAPLEGEIAVLKAKVAALEAAPAEPATKQLVRDEMSKAIQEATQALGRTFA